MIKYIKKVNGHNNLETKGVHDIYTVSHVTRNQHTVPFQILGLLLAGIGARLVFVAPKCC
jgi:hypothetical protein